MSIPSYFLGLPADGPKMFRGYPGEDIDAPPEDGDTRPYNVIMTERQAMRDAVTDGKSYDVVLGVRDEFRRYYAAVMRYPSSYDDFTKQTFTTMYDTYNTYYNPNSKNKYDLVNKKSEYQPRAAS